MKAFVCMLLALVCTTAVAQPPPNPLAILRNAMKRAVQQGSQPARPTQAAQSAAAADGASTAPSAPSAPLTIDEQPTPAAPVQIDFKALPDVEGVHLGMPLEDALTALRAQYKGAVQVTAPIAFEGTSQPAVYQFGANIVYAGSSPDVVWVEVTAPPQAPRVWRIQRRLANQQPMLHANVLAALRKKYGPETVAFKNNAEYSTSPDAIARSDVDAYTLWWIFDERGRPQPLPASGPAALGNCVAPLEAHTDDISRSFHVFNLSSPDSQGVVARNFCTSSLVFVSAHLGYGQVMTGFSVEADEFPLGSRAAAAAFAAARAAAQRQHDETLKKAAGNTPTL
ncbi:MAG TPA: hypothetical protein VN660_10795 [Steroidobacteraceae bacterium]|nr:hypothetical protein [Steroidobacteraceae bacterium]